MNRLRIFSLFLLNIVPGLILINEGLFHLDSVCLARAVEDTYRSGMLHGAAGGRYGSVIVNLATYFPFFVGGYNADFSVRMTSVLFHSLSVIMFYLLIQELFDDCVWAFAGALLLSFTPIYFVPDTYGKEHGIAMFFLLSSFFLMLRGIKRRSNLLLALSGLTLAFSVSARESILMAVPFYYIFFLGMSFCITFSPFKITLIKTRLNPASLLAVSAPFVGVLSMLYFIYLKDIIASSLAGPTPSTISTATYFMGIYSAILPYALKDFLISVPVPILIFSAVGMIKMLYSSRTFYFAIFFSLWFLLLFYVGNLSEYCPRHLDVVLIPVYVFCGYTLSALYSKQRVLTAIVITYFVGSMFIFMYPMLDFRHSYCGPKRFAEYVQRNTEENAIIIAADNSQAIEYYGHRKTVQYPRGDPDKADIFVIDISRYLQNQVPIYVIETGMTDFDNFVKKVVSRFTLHLVGEALNEDFHRPELSLQLYKEKLYKLSISSPDS